MDLPLNPAQPASAFTALVRDLTDKYHALWNGMPQELPAFGRRFSPAERAEKETELERLAAGATPSRRAYRELSRQERAALRGRARTATVRLLATPASGHLEDFFDACELVTDEFVRMADAFDPSISDCDIHQALRNQWVFNSIQRMLGLPITLSPSSFAYSLLYPCTDNMLDGTLPAAADKRVFLSWLSGRLQGRPEPPRDCGTRAISWLLRLIEAEYPRAGFPMVHESLQAIHRAQEKSLGLHSPLATADDDALTPLTIEKGGTSVLVDGFLAAAHLGRPAIDALFGYGVLLQLIDDLQDVAEDAEAGHSTPFVRAAARGPLDAMADRLFQLTRSVACTLETLNPVPQTSLPGLVAQSCLLQIQSAIALHPVCFTPSYQMAVEERSPLSFAFIRGYRQRASEIRSEP